MLIIDMILNIANSYHQGYLSLIQRKKNNRSYSTSTNFGQKKNTGLNSSVLLIKICKKKQKLTLKLTNN